MSWLVGLKMGGRFAGLAMFATDGGISQEASGRSRGRGREQVEIEFNTNEDFGCGGNWKLGQ